MQIGFCIHVVSLTFFQSIQLNYVIEWQHLFEVFVLDISNQDYTFDLCLNKDIFIYVFYSYIKFNEDLVVTKGY